MPAGTRHQVLAELNAVANQPALAMKRFAGPHTIIALDTEVEVHHQQGVGLNYPELPHFLQQFREFWGDGTVLLLSPRDNFPHLNFNFRKAAAEIEKIV